MRIRGLPGVPGSGPGNGLVIRKPHQQDLGLIAYPTIRGPGTAMTLVADHFPAPRPAIPIRAQWATNVWPGFLGRSPRECQDRSYEAVEVRRLVTGRQRAAKVVGNFTRSRYTARTFRAEGQQSCRYQWVTEEKIKTGTNSAQGWSRNQVEKKFDRKSKGDGSVLLPFIETLVSGRPRGLVGDSHSHQAGGLSRRIAQAIMREYPTPSIREVPYTWTASLARSGDP
ncbi:MAG: hypothetical protein ACREYC_25355 [Gammaproteobacteria bacterium]